MAKYDQRLNDLPQLLSQARNVLIALPANADVDKLASGLSLFLALQKSGKKVSIVTETNLQVAHTNLFGVGEIKQTVPSGGDGNFIITLDNVVDSTGQMQTVPALEKLDWYPEGANLNLVFHVVPGQRFEPKNISSHHENEGFQLIFVIGAPNLTDLGAIYTQNALVLGQTPIVNIDNSSSNANYGKVNLLDYEASSISEIIAHLLPSLGMTQDADIATNIITGIYEATGNLTQKVTADTFMAAGLALQSGARLPQPSQSQVQNPVQAPSAISQPQVASQPVQEEPKVTIEQPQPTQPEPQAQTTPQDGNGFDLRQVFNLPQLPAEPQAAAPIPQTNNEFLSAPPVINVPASAPKPITPPAVHTSSPERKSEPTPQHSSPEERPMGEYATSPSHEIDSAPTPDWLVPKIFKGGSLG